MIINSADGDSHMILDNMEAWEARENYIVAYSIGRKDWLTIGTFASHERAQEVANKILLAFLEGQKAFQMPMDEEPQPDEPDPNFDEHHWQEVTDKTERNEG
ncbi:MAG: hypothetical protein LUD72_07185 [Bacteroidales bacterium]|nr:hypothetical protein [Bacteroidales bacterium]